MTMEVTPVAIAKAKKPRAVVQAETPREPPKKATSPSDGPAILLKLEETRALIAKADATKINIGSMNDRLAAVPRLLDEEKYSVAMEVLNEIQAEIKTSETAPPPTSELSDPKAN